MQDPQWRQLEERELDLWGIPRDHGNDYVMQCAEDGSWAPYCLRCECWGTGEHPLSRKHFKKRAHQVVQIALRTVIRLVRDLDAYENGLQQ